jgi:methylglyoxal synthase
MKGKKTIALVAHDNRKKDLMEWVEFNYNKLSHHRLICTGTTGRMVEQAIKDKWVSNGESSERSEKRSRVRKLKSGPLGGDQQLGALISSGKIDVLIFLWDPMEAQPHDVDVKALLRIATVYNIPTAVNRSTADFLISSHLIEEDYAPVLKDYSGYIMRSIDNNR